MPIGKEISRPTDDERQAGLRGWVLFPQVLIVLSLLYMAIIVVTVIISGESVTALRETPMEVAGVVLLLTAFFTLGVLSIWHGQQQRKIARYLMIAFFGISLPGQLSHGSVYAVADLVMIAYLAFSQRARLTYHL
jgi:hypothetical protein